MASIVGPVNGPVGPVETGVRVLRIRAEKAVARIDQAIGRWLARMEDDVAERPGAVAALRRLIAFGLVALLVVPAVLSFVLPPSLALPIGAAAVLASILAGAAILLSLRKARPVTADMRRDAAPPQLDAALMPGLVLFLDEQGQVETIGGRDATEFPAHLRRCAGQFLAERVHVSDRIALIQAFDALRQGENKAFVELRFANIGAGPTIGGRDQFVHAMLDMTARRDASGKLCGIVGQLRDLAEQELLRGEIASKTAEAAQANDAKARFLAAVSHELRTPLNAVLGFSDILAGEYFGRLENDRQREYVALIRQSGAHLLSVVNAMLDMSRLEAGRYALVMEPFRISDTIAACEAMLGLQAREKGLLLTSRLQRDMGEVVADQRAIRQILINLAGNAIKFTEKGGVVSIDASMEGNMLKICVSDTGIGIAADKMELLGQPFMQVQNEYTRRYEGTGLGLSLVKGLVALHGGEFSIASRAGEGTVVTIILPADGSGAALGREKEPNERMVEFPPRLKESAKPAGAAMTKDERHGRVKTKSA